MVNATIGPVEPVTEEPRAQEEAVEEPAAERPPHPEDSPAESLGPSSLADGKERSLDPRSVTASRLSGGIGALVMFSATTITLVFILFLPFDSTWRYLSVGGWLLLNGLVSTHAWFWPALSYRYTAWKLDEQGMHIRQGVLWRSEIDVPKSRVQHTDVSRGPLQRAFGIATLVIHTAGTHNASVPLPGLSYEHALAIRDHLIEGGDDDGV